MLALLTASGQNTLDKLNLTSASPAQVAYGLRQLSTFYTGPAIKVRRSIDDAEASVAFDGSTIISGTSIVTLTSGVTVGTSLGTTQSGTISTVAEKTGTISITLNKTGTISGAKSSKTITGTGTLFQIEMVAGDLLYKTDNTFLGVVQSVASNTSLTLSNNCILDFTALAFRTAKATVAGSGTLFSTELAVGDRIFSTSHNYLGTISSISSEILMTINARDAVSSTGISFEGTSATVTGSVTGFASGDVGKMLISNNVTLGIITSLISPTSVTLTGNAGAAVSGATFKSTEGTMPFSTFYSGTSVFVNTWYDQSGYGRDAIQPLAAHQPRIVNAGIITTVNSKPTLDFSLGTGSVPVYLQTGQPASWLNSTLYTQNVISAEGTPLSAFQIPISTTGGNGPNNSIMHFGYRSTSQYTVAQYGNDQNFEVFATNALELHTAVKNNISSSQMYHNGTSLGTVTSGAGSHLRDLGLLNIGYYIPTGSNYKGSISEIIVFAKAITTEVPALNTNQLAYYGISTVTWTGAVSTAWENIENWVPKVVPTSTSPSLVAIPNTTNKPLISGTSPATSILVQSGATLTVNSGGTLQLYGTLSGTGNNCYITGTLEIMGTGQTILSGTYYAATVYNLKLSKSGGSIVSMVTDFKIQNDLIIGTSSKLFIQNSKLTLNGTITGGSDGGLRGSTNAILEIAGSATPSLSFEQSGTYNNLKGLILSTTGAATLASNLILVNSGGITFSNGGKLAIESNTLTLSGLVTNNSSFGLIGGGSSNLIVDGILNRTLSFDQTTPGTTNLLNNFSINTTAVNTLTAANVFSVNGTLTIATGQTLNMGTNALGGTLTVVANSGILNTQNASSTPIPSGKTWGGTVNYNSASTAQTAMAGTYNNLSISTTGGAMSSGDITVNGILSLAATPNETNGTLEMTNNYGDYSNITTPEGELTTRGTAACDILDSDVLTMGPSATYSGSGDVTGRVKRISIAANTEYSFGNSYSTITFSSGGTLPSAVMFVITKGSDRGIHANATAQGKTPVQRLYQIIQTGGSGNTFTLKLRYLESELNSNLESNLVLWDHHIPYSSINTPHEHGKTSQNLSENWVSLSGHAISYLATTEIIGGFSKYWMINSSASTDGNTWNGAGAGDLGYQWDFPSNWTSGIVPTAGSKVIIPVTAKYPTLAANSTAASITLQAGASLNGGTNTTLTISGGPASNGGVGSWNNSGTFNPGTSTVIFDFTDATISGETNFNNVTISNAKVLTPQTGAIVRIGGTITINGTWNTYLFDNTVEYNGDVQTVIKPNGATPVYRNLILSGTGTKFLPADVLSVLGDFSMSGTASTEPSHSLSVGGDFTLGSGTIFTAGSLTHSIGGNFENNGGTFTPGSSTFNFNGTTSQTIGGTTTSVAFNNVKVSNVSGVTLLNNTITNDALELETGALTVTAGKSLDAKGTTTINTAQCLVLKSDASGTASFKDNGTISGSGTARIERYLTPYSLVSDLKFHFLSSPVIANSQLIESEFLDFSSSEKTDFYKWDEPNNQWTNFRGSAFVLRNEDFGNEFKFVPGKGYLVAYPTAVTKNFIGLPCTGTLIVDCTHGSGGWNLIGNPYPSSVDWDLVSKGDGMDEALYYYDNATPGYKYYIWFSGPLGAAASGYIAPMQGIMVHAKTSGTQTVSFANDFRTHEGQNVFYKSAQLASNILDLKVEGNNKSDYARVCFYDRATDNFDGEYDAYKLFSYSANTSELYSVTADNTPMAINTLPETVMEGGSVPVSFKPGSSGDFMLTAEKINSFDAGTTIMLEDKATNTWQKLNDKQAYTFTATSTDATDRFVLHFKNTTSIPETEAENPFNISIIDGVINVGTSSAGLSGKIRVSDMTGRTIAVQNLVSGTPTRVNLEATPGVYVVSVYTSKDIYSRKVVVY
jgi:hypothetical protein